MDPLKRRRRERRLQRRRVDASVQSAGKPFDPADLIGKTERSLPMPFAETAESFGNMSANKAG